jgi:hypothetical protein
MVLHDRVYDGLSKRFFWPIGVPLLRRRANHLASANRFAEIERLAAFPDVGQQNIRRSERRDASWPGVALVASAFQQWVGRL